MECGGGTTTISCTGNSVHDCRGSSASVSSINVVSAPSVAGAGDSINVRVDWTGWHWDDDNHFAFFMKPTSSGSWQYIDSCKSYQADEDIGNKYTMDCPITIPSDYNGDYYIRVTANDNYGYCEPGESNVDAEGETVITVSRISISCTEDSSHSCSSHDSVSSIDLVSAPPSGSPGDSIVVGVDWTGWHWTDENHFALFMKPTSGGSWEYVDSCYTYQDDSGTNYYTMDCDMSVPSKYSAGTYYLGVTANDDYGYCEPGESGVDAEGQTTIEVSSCYDKDWSPSWWNGPFVWGENGEDWSGWESYDGYFWTIDSIKWDWGSLQNLKNHKLDDIYPVKRVVYEFRRSEDPETWDGEWADLLTCNVLYYSDLPDHGFEIEEADDWWLFNCADPIQMAECGFFGGCNEEYEINAAVDLMDYDFPYIVEIMFRVDSSDGDQLTKWHSEIELDFGLVWPDPPNLPKIEGCEMESGEWQISLPP